MFLPSREYGLQHPLRPGDWGPGTALQAGFNALKQPRGLTELQVVAREPDCWGLGENTGDENEALGCRAQHGRREGLGCGPFWEENLGSGHQNPAPGKRNPVTQTGEAGSRNLD